MISRKLRKQAYREAATLLAADMDDADLLCEFLLTEEQASEIREFIRNQIVKELENKGRETT